MSNSAGAELGRRRRGRISLNNALQKVYIIKARAKPGGLISVPDCLVGKRIKLILEEENNE